MRGLALAGFVALSFGLGSFYATDEFGVFSVVNLVAGGAALGVALVAGARRVRVVGGRHSRPVILRGLFVVVLAVVAAVALERLATLADVRLDWTFEQRYALAPATIEACRALVERGPVEVLLFRDRLDPRIRRTRLFLQTLARHCDVRLRELDLDDVPDEVDAYGVGGSNSLVVRASNDFEVVPRPTEGALYEALFRLRSTEAGTLAVLRGEGEGDPEREDDLGYAGLATALTTEGYEVRSVVSAAMHEVPEGTDAVLVIAPQRRLVDPALEALRRYLAGGGRLIALLEPGVDSGVEEILAEWGLATPPGVVIDPASGSVNGEVSGLCPLAYNYEYHPVTTGLDRNRMTFFCGVRSFDLRKPEVEDRLQAVVQSSPRAWLDEDVSVLSHHSVDTTPPDGVRPGYLPIAVTGQYRRDGVETRIFAVGDADFASNRYLRALYNLDLAVNGVHWTLAREPAIALRPKIRESVQFPMPLTDSLKMFYGVGLLLPELLLIVGGVVWLQRRSA